MPGYRGVAQSWLGREEVLSACYESAMDAALATIFLRGRHNSTASASNSATGRRRIFTCGDCQCATTRQVFQCPQEFLQHSGDLLPKGVLLATKGGVVVRPWNVMYFAAMNSACRTARCACGQLSIACYGEPENVSVCHCIECQHRTGSVFGIAAFYLQNSVQTSGQPKIFTRNSDSGFDVVHHFCGNCGTTVYWYPARKPEIVGVGVGCFGDGKFPRPHQQVYEHHRHSWINFTI